VGDDAGADVAAGVGGVGWEIVGALVSVLAAGAALVLSAVTAAGLGVAAFVSVWA